MLGEETLLLLLLLLLPLMLLLTLFGVGPPEAVEDVWQRLGIKHCSSRGQPAAAAAAGVLCVTWQAHVVRTATHCGHTTPEGACTERDPHTAAPCQGARLSQPQRGAVLLCATDHPTTRPPTHAHTHTHAHMRAATHL